MKSPRVTRFEHISRCVASGDEFKSIVTLAKKQSGGVYPPDCFLVRVFITDLILRHSAEVVETYSQSTENACVYKKFCNTKGI